MWLGLVYRYLENKELYSPNEKVTDTFGEKLKEFYVTSTDVSTGFTAGTSCFCVTFYLCVCITDIFPHEQINAYGRCFLKSNKKSCK